MFILGTIGIVAVAIGGLLLISNEEPAPKSRKPKSKKKSRKRSVWDSDPFFGTPLQKID